MIANIKLYKYLIDHMPDAIQMFIKEECPNCPDEEFENLWNEIETLYITQASTSKTLEEISPKWLDIIERIELKKYCK